MGHSRVVQLLTVVALCMTPSAILSGQPGYRLENVQPGDVITNTTIVRMLERKLPDDVIVGTIERSARADLDTTAEAIIKLKDAGASDDVIRAVIRRARVTPPAVAEQLPSSSSVANTNIRTSPRYWSIGGRGGINATLENTIGVKWSVGGEAWGPLTSYLAVGGGYFYNRMASVSQRVCQGGVCINSSVKVNFHEVLGGFKIALPTRFSPYAVAGVGLVSIAAGGRVGSIQISDPNDNKFAFGMGGGFDGWINNHVGIGVDFRAIRPSDYVWYGRLTVGPVIRF